MSVTITGIIDKDVDARWQANNNIEQGRSK